VLRYALVALHTMSADERATEPCQAPTPKETPTTAAAVATTATTSNSNSNSNSSKTSTSTSKIDIPSIKIIDGDSDSDRNFTIALDVPGYHLNNIDITLKPDDHVDAMVLEIKGKRDNRVYSASFEKRFRLRDSRFDLEKVDAELLDGLLTITLSKKDLGKDGGRRVIRVRDGSSSSATGGALNLSEAKTSREAQAGQPQEVTANDHDGQKHSDAIKVEVEDVNEEVGDCDVVDVTTTMDGDSTSDGNNIDDSEWEKFEA